MSLRPASWRLLSMWARRAWLTTAAMAGCQSVNTVYVTSVAVGAAGVVGDDESAAGSGYEFD